MDTIVFYITDHGFGHAARSCDLLLALRQSAPRARLLAVTTVEPGFLEARLADARVERREASFDVGVLQQDSVRGDPDATLAPALELVRDRPRRLREETGFLRSVGANAVVCDIPALPFEAAAAAGCPSFGVGNFSWNWIYEAYARGQPGWAPVVEMYRRGYAQADLLLRLPFHEPMDAFPRIRDVPLFARTGRNRRQELARRFDRPAGARWVLVCFASLAWPPEALARLGALRDTVFWTVRPLEWKAPGFLAVDRSDIPFTDLLASCDVVLTKPGFGIVSECAVARKPMVYVLRDGFAEAPLLEAAIRRFLPSAPVTLPDLYAGRLEDALNHATQARAPETPPPSDGGDTAAACILAGAGS